MNHHQRIAENNYRNDPRVRAMLDREPLQVDDQRMQMQITVHNGNEVWEEWVPFTYEVCPLCGGRGKHVNPSIDSNGLTADDFAEDPDFLEEYMGGTYDVQCNKCKGRRVVPVMQIDRLPKELAEQITRNQQDEADFRRMQDAERRYGA